MKEKLTSYEALKAKREALNTSDSPKNIEVRVAMATCAIATGAHDVYETLEKIIQSEGLLNVRLKSTGCMGYCHSEPTVEVLIDGQTPIMYGPVDEKIAMDIVEKHLKNGEMLTDHVVHTCHVNA